MLQGYRPGYQKSNIHGNVASLTVSTDGAFDGIGEIHGATGAPTFVQFPQIDLKIDLKENSVKVMGPYDPAEPLACLVDQLKKGM